MIRQAIYQVPTIYCIKMTAPNTLVVASVEVLKPGVAAAQHISQLLFVFHTLKRTAYCVESKEAVVQITLSRQKPAAHLQPRPQQPTTDIIFAVTSKSKYMPNEDFQPLDSTVANNKNEIVSDANFLAIDEVS